MDFRETLESLKLCKSYDGDMKFYARKNQIMKEKNVSTIFIKRFYSQVLNILLLLLNKKKNTDVLFQILRNFRKNPFHSGKLKLLEFSKALQNWAQSGTNLLNKS